MDDFPGSLVFKGVNLKVAWIVIHSAEVISIIKVKDVRTYCFAGTAWDLVQDQWFFEQFLLVAVSNLALRDLIFNFSRHARPLDNFSSPVKTAFNTCVHHVDTHGS